MAHLLTLTLTICFAGVYSGQHGARRGRLSVQRLRLQEEHAQRQPEKRGQGQVAARKDDFYTV